MPVAIRASGAALILNRRRSHRRRRAKGVKVPNPKDVSQLNVGFVKSRETEER